jgi:hypothetical protein
MSLKRNTFRPRCESLEDRLVPASMAPELSSVVLNGDFIGVTAAREEGDLVTLTTNGNSGFRVGNQISVSGFSGDAIGYNGAWTISGVSGNKVQYKCTSLKLAATADGLTLPCAISANSSSDLIGSQRSMVDSVAYSFNMPVKLDGQSITMSAGTCDILYGSATPAKDVPGFLLTPLGDGSVWVVTWTSSDANRIIGHSIADGVYKITLNSDHVTSVADGTAMTAQAQTDSFYRLYGDITGPEFNGKIQVNNRDQLKFDNANPSATGDPKYLAALDFDGDGKIGDPDKLQFSNRYLSTWSGFKPTLK